MTPSAEDIKRAISDLERDLKQDGAALAQRDRLASLERQIVAVQRALGDTEALTKTLAEASVDAVTAGQPFDRKALDKARAERASHAATLEILEAAMRGQRAVVAHLAHQHADRAAARLRPVFAEAIAALSAQVESLAAIDTVVGELHQIALRELGTDHADLTAGFKFTSTARIAGWRQHVRERFSAMAGASR